MDYCTDHRTWMNVARFAESRGKDWTYIIFGRGAPTGKSYLRNRLVENGYNAIELSEDIAGIVDYRDQKNHYLIYEDRKLVVIILNQRLPEDIYPGRTNSFNI